VCLHPSRPAPRLRPTIGYVALIELEKVTGEQGPEAVYFVSKAGAKVFNAGSIVVWGLGKPEFEREKHKVFNRNLLKYFLEN
jgi:hypothetical protein